MKKAYLFTATLILIVASLTCRAHAGAPFVTAEGVGGVGFNPLAYVAATPGEEGFKIGAVEIAKPRLGAFYVNLNDAVGGTDWTTLGIATAFNKRLEVSFGYELVAIGGFTKNTHKYNYGAKLLLLEENAFGTKFLPAVSVGTVYKRTDNPIPINLGGNDGFDVYLVATKLITQLPMPVLVSAGVLSTQAHVNGILGFDRKRTETMFANFDIFPVSWAALGMEFKMGPDYGNYKDEDYFDLHGCWFVNKNFTLAAAFTMAGDRRQTADQGLGLGGGLMLSAQYAF